jgi:hypothetical protein
MRDKIFETSANLSVTDNQTILDAKDAGSSVALSLGMWLLIILIAVAAGSVAVQVMKKVGKEGDSGKGADVEKK